MASTLSFRVEVAADQATQSLQVLSQAFNQAGITAKSALLRVGEGSKGAGEASSSLEQRIKSLKGEMASGDRTINFFANSLNAIVPEASAAGQGIRLLADGLIGGLGLGFALQGVMAIIQSFGESLKEAEEAERRAAETSKRAAAERLKAYQDADREFRRLQFLRAGGTAEAFDAQEKNKGATEDIAQARQNLDQAKLSLAALQNRALGGAANPVDLEKALARVRDAETALKTAEGTGARVVGAGALRMEEAVGKATKAIEAQGKAAQDTALDLRNLADIQNGTVGFGAGTTRNYMPEGTGMLTAGAAGAAALSSFQDSFKRTQAIDAQAKAAEERSQELVTNIAATWASGLAEMVATTDFSAQNMTRIFVQMMSQIIAQALPAQLGPFGMIAGALLGGLLGGKRTPSAAGGWWDTGTYEGLAYIHKREMIADEPLAKAIRSGNAGGGNTTINVNGNLDGKGVFRTLTASDGDVARAMKRMQRRRRA